MLPPPIATPTTTATTTMNISQHKPALDNTQQSSFLLSNSTIINTTTNTTARLKNFFHKTLAKANFNSNPSAGITTASSSSSSLSLPTAADVLATQVYDGLITASIAGESVGNASMAVNSLTNTTTHHLETTTAAAAFPTAQTVATFIAAGNKNRATTIIVYPTGKYWGN